jgi:hypothetical protein
MSKILFHIDCITFSLKHQPFLSNFSSIFHLKFFHFQNFLFMLQNYAFYSFHLLFILEFTIILFHYFALNRFQKKHLLRLPVLLNFNYFSPLRVHYFILEQVLFVKPRNLFLLLCDQDLMEH